MKHTLLIMFWITGLLLAGSESSSNLANQFIISMTGLCIFALSSWLIVRNLRG